MTYHPSDRGSQDRLTQKPKLHFKTTFLDLQRVYKTSLRSLSRSYQEEQRTDHKIIDLEKEGTSIKQKEENQMLEYKLHLQVIAQR